MQITADFKKVEEICKNGFKNTSFTLTNKASNMAISVSRLINIHKLRCPMIHNYCIIYSASMKSYQYQSFDISENI